MKFGKLDIPRQWKDEFTKYPHGYTIFEALCSWASQVDDMVDSQNRWEYYLDNFVDTFEFELQKEVKETLSEWKDSGLLDEIITDAILPQISENRNSIVGIEEQLQDIESRLNWINPDMFEGSDYVKLQLAIEMVLDSTDTRMGITLSRVYTLELGETLMVNRDGDRSKEQIRIYGINGGIKKENMGYMFSSLDTLKTNNEHWTGEIELKNLLLTSVDGAKTTIIDGDNLIRVTICDCEIYNVDSLVKSTTYTQSFYILRNKIRYGMGTLLDTYNNYDLNFSDNLVEWCNNFFTFKGANGCKITNNLIEGIKGHTVLARVDSGCQSLLFDGNYLEFNNSYFDFTELRGYGLRVSNTYCHETDADKVFVYLPIRHRGYAYSQDQYLFMGNVSAGGSKGFVFNETPQSEVKITSISDNIGKHSHPEKICFINTTMSKEIGTTKIYQNGNMTSYVKTVPSVKVDYSTEVEPRVLTVDMGVEVSTTDIISVYGNAGGVSFGDIDVGPISVLNVYPNGTSIKIVFSGNEYYKGEINVSFKICVLKGPFSNYF